MTVNTTITSAAPAARGRACPLCRTPAGEPCQPKPAGDHLARYLDAYTAGQLTRVYLAVVLGELVVIDACAVIGSPAEPARTGPERDTSDLCPSVSSWGTRCTSANAAHAADPRIAHSDSNGDQWHDSPLDRLLAGGHAVAYEPDPAWHGSWFADLRDPSGRLTECGGGTTQNEALADLGRRLAGAR